MSYSDMSIPGKLQRTLQLVSVLVSILGIPSSVFACGPDFPVRLLADRNNTLLSMPEGNYAFEAGHLLPRDKQLPIWQEAKATAASTKNTKMQTEEQRIIAQMRDSQNVEAASAIDTHGLPVAARLYTLGAIAFSAKDPHATDYFRQVLALPVAEQQEWGLKAQYSLGRTLMNDFSVSEDDPRDALTHPDNGQLKLAMDAFQKVINRVKDGADDPNQLAISSLGQQARIHFWLGEIVPSVRLYAQQAAQGDESGGLSLQFVSSFLIDPKHQQELKQAISDPLVQQLVTIELFTRSGNLEMDESSTKETIDPILMLLNNSVENGFEGSDRLAALAYRSGQYTMADSLLKHAGGGGLAWWLRAKMALRKGDVKAAANAYSKATSAFPADESWGEQRNEDYESEMITPDCRISGERAILALNHGDYIQAMELMYRGKQEYWADVADIAERVLTLDELKAFVDRQVPAPATPLKTLKPGEYDGRQLTRDIQMRELLARRLMRTGRYQQAVNYFEIPENREIAQKYSSLLKQAGDKSKSSNIRAKAYYQAATLLRYSGLEFTGYEMTPDYAIYGAYASYLDDVFPTQNQRHERWVGVGEAGRAVKSLLPQDNHFLHYRWRAVGLAEKAADLLPKKSQAVSAVLCNAASWVISRDTKTGRKLYQRYVKEGAYYAEGAHFGDHCPTPEF